MAHCFRRSEGFLVMGASKIIPLLTPILTQSGVVDRLVDAAQVLPLTGRPATHREVVPSLGNAKQTSRIPDRATSAAGSQHANPTSRSAAIE
jgi:hypothetical protein